MRIALYKGTSLVSRAIRFITRSDYSHAAFVFDEGASKAAEHLFEHHGLRRNGLHFYHVGAVIEAWEPHVRNTLGIGNGHEPGEAVDVFEFVEPLSSFEEEHLVARLIPEIGTPYDWKDVLRFVTRRPGRSPKSRVQGPRGPNTRPACWPSDFVETRLARPTGKERWFCSELVFWGCEQIARRLFERTKAWEVPPGWIPRSPLLRFSERTVTG